VKSNDELRRLAETQVGLLTRAQLTAVTGTPDAAFNRTISRTLIPLSPRVFRLSGTPVGPVQVALAAVLDAGPGAALARTTGAHWWGIGRHRLYPLHVVTPGDRRLAQPLARIHTDTALDERQVVRRNGVPVTTPARTIVDLAAVLGSAPLGRALDAVLGRKLASLGFVSATLESLACRGRPGVRALRALIAERRDLMPAPESALECAFQDIARQAGRVLERQVHLYDEQGWISRVDFIDREAHVVALIDGAEFHSTLTDRRHDDIVTSRLQQAGWRVVRFADTEILFARQDVRRRLTSACTDGVADRAGI
jgi:very-short-patch-repair endonuclease